MPEQKEIERLQEEIAQLRRSLRLLETERLNKALAPEPMVARLAAYTKAAELLWNVVANAGGGDWGKETEEWQKAACLARDAYHSALNTAL